MTSEAGESALGTDHEAKQTILVRLIVILACQKKFLLANFNTSCVIVKFSIKVRVRVRVRVRFRVRFRVRVRITVSKK